MVINPTEPGFSDVALAESLINPSLVVPWEITLPTTFGNATAAPHIPMQRLKPQPLEEIYAYGTHQGMKSSKGQVDIVIHKDRLITKPIPDEFRGLAKKLAYGDHKGIATSAMAIEGIRENLREQVFLYIHRECQNLSPFPTFHSTHDIALQQFSFQSLTEELHKTCPWLMSCLEAAAQPNRPGRVTGKSQNIASAISFAASILLKQRSERFSSVASISSIVLYHGQASKAVRAFYSSSTRNLIKIDLLYLRLLTD